MAAIDDDLWKLRNALVDSATAELQKSELAVPLALIDVGIKTAQSIRDAAESLERLARAQEDAATSLKDIAMHFNHKVLHD